MLNVLFYFRQFFSSSFFFYIIAKAQGRFRMFVITFDGRIAILYYNKCIYYCASINASI